MQMATDIAHRQV